MPEASVGSIAGQTAVEGGNGAGLMFGTADQRAIQVGQSLV